MKKTFLAAALLSAYATAHAAWVTKDLGSLGDYGATRALSIASHVAGESGVNDGSPMYAFRTDSNGMQLLPGPTGGYGATGSAVNGAGDVVGIAWKADSTGVGFLYRHGVITELSLGGSYAEANYINHIGQVAGISTLPGDTVTNGFLYNRGVMTPLTLGSMSTIPTGMNASGEVTGFAAPTDNYVYSRAFLYSKGAMTDLGTLPGGSIASSSAINDAGQVAGYSSISGSDRPIYHAFRYDNGVMADLGTLGGPNSFAVSINGAGLVIGASDTVSGKSNFKSHAFISDGQHMTDLGTLGGDWSYPSFINGAGQIVGSSSLADGTVVPFLYENGVMHNVADLITGFTEIYGSVILNELGQIAGTGLVDGKPHAFLLTWVPDEASQSSALAAASMSLKTASPTTAPTGKASQPVAGKKFHYPAALEALMEMRGVKCPPHYCTPSGKKK